MNCPRDNCPNKANTSLRFGVLPCDKCTSEDRLTKIKTQPEFYTSSQTDRIQKERDLNAKDMIQPWETKDWKPSKDFIDAYPEKAKDYFTDEQLRAI